MNDHACALHKDGNTTRGFETLATAWKDDVPAALSKEWPGATVVPELGIKLVTLPNISHTHCQLTKWWHAGSSSRGVTTVSLVCGPVG